MRPDYALSMRAAILKALKASPDVTVIIPKASIYPSTVPANAAWPFSRIGSVIGSPFRADCLNSTSFRVLVQGFTKNVTSESGVLLLPAEDNAYRIGSAFKIALDGQTIALGDGSKAVFEWERTIPLVSDDEASSWYVTATFEVEITPP
jgi:hypothetical protein